jgi:hypothetical protein
MVTETTTTLSEELKTVENGFNKKTEKPDTSSSDMKETITALHAQTHTPDTQLPELDIRTQESTLIESSTGDHQSTHGDTSTEESPREDTATVTRTTTTHSERLKIAVLSSERRNQKLNSSSSEKNPTGIALPAHNHTEDTQPPELQLTTQESMFIES